MRSKFWNQCFLVATFGMALLRCSGSAGAQDKNKPAPPTGTAPTASGSPAPAQSGAATSTNPTTAAATMQLRREISGSFLCRFVTSTDETAALVALPAPV